PASAGSVATIPLCRRRAPWPCARDSSEWLLPEPFDAPPERQLLLPRLPTQLEEAGHATAGRGGRERAVEAVSLLEEPLDRRQLRRIHRALGESDRLGREGRDPVGEPLDERTELARPEGTVQGSPSVRPDARRGVGPERAGPEAW